MTKGIYGIVRVNKQLIGAADIYRMDEGDTLWFLITALTSTLKMEYRGTFEELLWKPGEIDDPEAYFTDGAKLPPLDYKIKAPNGLLFHFKWYTL